MQKENFIGSKNIILKSAKIIDPLKAKEFISDICIKNGVIKEIGTEVCMDINKKGIENENIFIRKFDDTILVNASGYIAVPGFIDMHVHLREPGDEDEENIESGINAALRGGITSVACMPNTKPVLDKPYLIEYIINKSIINDYNIYPLAAITRDLTGLEITEFGLLQQAGAVGYSDDGLCVMDAKLMYEAMKYAASFNMPLILHEEDLNFSKYGLVNEGYYSSKLGLDGISSLGEEIIIARDIMLAKKTGARIHITHVSSKGSLGLIKQAKEDGVNITCDATPHHLYFNDSILTGFDTNYKVNPPLRSEEDQEALIKGIKDGVIDAIASDHAPHLASEKNKTFNEAAFGVIGLETLFNSTFTKLCRSGKLNLNKLIYLLTAGPAKILNVKGNIIEPGEKANITLIDLEQNKKISENDFISKSKNSPFIGENLYGEIVCTINNGKISFIR